MSLAIYDFNGVNLVEQPPATVNIIAEPVVGARAIVRCVAVADGTLPFDYVTGTLYWNDGSRPVVYNGTTAGTLTLDTFRSFQPGSYTVRVEAHNYNTPAWDTVSVNFAFEVQTPKNAPPNSPLIYGPILPKDAGFPNTDQWNWNRGEDTEVLVSSLKMLLMTAKGERVMQPTYGTNIRLLLFEAQSVSIEGLVQQEIVDAVSKWEPRVSFQFLSVNRTGDRELTVEVTFASKLNNSMFSLPLVFST